LKSATGKAGYIVDTGRGFYPENLLHCAPIVPGSFINTFFTTSQLMGKTGISFRQSHLLLEIINALMMIGLLFCFSYLFLRKRFFREADPFRIFLWIGFFISAATFVSLGYLSASYKPQAGYDYGWNYLNEPRYFMFVGFYIQVAFVGWVFLYGSWKKSIFLRMVVGLLSLLLLIEVAHDIYFNAKVALDPRKYEVAPYEEADYTYFSNTLDTLSREDTNADLLIVAESDDFFRLMGTYLGHKGIYDGKNLVKELPAIKKRTKIIFALYDNELEPYRQFLERQGAILLDRVNGVNFYIVTLQP
jgi:hypothetical protein